MLCTFTGMPELGVPLTPHPSSLIAHSFPKLLIKNERNPKNDCWHDFLMSSVYVSLSFSIILSLFIELLLSISFCLFLFRSLAVYLVLYISLSISLWFCLPVYLFLCISTWMFPSFYESFAYLSICIFYCPLSLYISVYLPLSLIFHPELPAVLFMAPVILVAKTKLPSQGKRRDFYGIIAEN